MVGPTRLLLALGLLFASTAGPRTLAAPGDDPEPPPARPSADADLAGPPAEFVPLNPRTVEDRRRIEAIQAYGAARSLEDQRRLPEAIAELERALELDPGSVAVLRRLSRLRFALGRTEQAVEASRKALESEPDDTETVSRLVRYYERNEPEGAEALLNELRANPKLDPKSPTALLIDFSLGRLYGDRLQRIDRGDPRHAETLTKAADAFGRVLEALDRQEAARLPLADQPRIFGEAREADAYMVFGTVLEEAGRHDEAIRAFRRGLIYAPGEAQLKVRLARALLEAGRPAEALALAERLLNEADRRPDAYELLGRSLEALGRGDEVIPRLEAAAEADPQNRAVRYALADRYAKAGRRDDARGIFETLRATTPNAQDFGPLSAWLLQEGRDQDLIKLFGEAVTRRDSLEAIQPQLEAISNDPALVDRLLDAALKMMAEDPPSLSKESRRVLALVAEGPTKKTGKLAELLRLAVRRDPNPQDYTDLVDTLSGLGLFDEAAGTQEEMLIKYPALRGARTLATLGRVLFQAGSKEKALDALDEARRLEPNNMEVLYYQTLVLSGLGRTDQALEAIREVLKLDPDNELFNRLLGSVLMQAGRDDDAIAHFRALLDRYPTNEEIVRVSRSGLSAIYVNRGDYAQGEAELEILFRKDPDDAGVNNDLGYLYADQGKNLEQAEAMIRKALEEDQENGAYLDSLGWVLFKRGKVKEAVETLKQAVDSGDDADGTINDHLGDAYFRLGEFAKARESWDVAAKLAESSQVGGEKRLPEIRKKLESLKEVEAAPRPATGEKP